jgi:hypothetical protein
MHTLIPVEERRVYCVRRYGEERLARPPVSTTYVEYVNGRRNGTEVRIIERRG